MKRGIKWSLLFLGILGLGTGGFVGYSADAFNRSMDKVYDIELPELLADASIEEWEVLTRGRYLAEAVGGCPSCHGADLGGQDLLELDWAGTIRAPNLTQGEGGVGKVYGAPELTRLLQHGVRYNGTGVLAMPVEPFEWWSDADYLALAAYLATVEPVDRLETVSRISLWGKLLDQEDKLVLDRARRVDHRRDIDRSVERAPDKEQGAFVARLCTRCHWEPTLEERPEDPVARAPSAGRLARGADALGAYTQEQFVALLNKGVKSDGEPVAEAAHAPWVTALDAVDEQALWQFIESGGVPRLPAELSAVVDTSSSKEKASTAKEAEGGH